MSPVLGSGGDTNHFEGPPQLAASFIVRLRAATAQEAPAVTDVQPGFLLGRLSWPNSTVKG
jgi:hypothetical protein